MSEQLVADVIRVCYPKAWFTDDNLRKGQWGCTADTKEVVTRMPDGSYHFIGSYDDASIRGLIDDVADAIQNLGDIYLKLTGGTLTGDLNIRKSSPTLRLGDNTGATEAKIGVIGNGTSLTIESGLGNLKLHGRGNVYDSGVSGHTFRGAGVTIDGQDLNVVNGRYLLNGQPFGGGSTPGDGIHFLISEMGLSNVIGSMVSFSQVS
jgi:hypothetical protein